MHTRRATIALVGAGPRGASLLERMSAHLEDIASDVHLDIHIIDDAPHGAGRIWRVDQPRDLCMNTLADAVTLFTEPGSTVAGPIIEGPTLYEWAALIRDVNTPGIPATHTATFLAFPPRASVADDYREELAALNPESHPSRALYGEYIAWFFDRAVSLLEPRASIVHHDARAIAVRTQQHSHSTPNSSTLVKLDNGREILAHAVLLATGWLPVKLTSEENEIHTAVRDRPELTWVPPKSPIEQDLSTVRAESHVIVRGLGMSFFDTVSLLTIGRGGRFVTDPNTDLGLRYEPSGDEPVLHATSRRGVPFRAKSLYHALPPRAPQRFLKSVDWNEVSRPIDFDRHVWPRIVADAFLDHFLTLARISPEAVTSEPRHVFRSIEAALAASEETTDGELESTVCMIEQSVAEFIPNTAERFNLLSEMRLGEHRFASPEVFQRWILSRVQEDLRDAELGESSPTKAGLWSISSARSIANHIGTLGGFDAESRTSGFRLLNELGGMVGSGPPAFRNRQLLALVDAGLLHFIGARPTVIVTELGFEAKSRRVKGSHVTADALIDAWVPAHDLARSADPLTHDLVAQGRARHFEVRCRTEGTAKTPSIEIHPATGRLIRSDGSEDPSIHLAGIPADGQLHGTLISPMPGTDPPMLRETDRVARSALRLVLPTEPRRTSEYFGED